MIKPLIFREEWLETSVDLGSEVGVYVGEWLIYDADPERGGRSIGRGVTDEYPMAKTAHTKAVGDALEWLHKRDVAEYAKSLGKGGGVHRASKYSS